MSVAAALALHGNAPGGRAGEPRLQCGIWWDGTTTAGDGSAQATKPAIDPARVSRRRQRPPALASVSDLEAPAGEDPAGVALRLETMPAGCWEHPAVSCTGAAVSARGLNAQLRQKAGVNSTSTVNTSRRPKSMPKDSSHLAPSGRLEKLPAGPMIWPRPGPTLAIAVAAPLKAVT